MVTTRRNGGPSAKHPTSASPKTLASHQDMANPLQGTSNALVALIPTPLEAITFAIHPLLLLLGSLFSIFDPAARAAPYSPTTQSHPPAQAPAYFALKSNVLNIYFVKVAWLWVSSAYALFLFLHPSNGPTPTGLPVLTPKRLRGLLRYFLVTIWWILVTQWCFGPALIDRGFRISGGACDLAEKFEGTGTAREFVTSQACKQVGGVWKGGHDISGHVFILVLGSVSLLAELLPTITKRNGLKEERKVMTKSGEVVELSDELTEENTTGGKIGIIVPSVVVGLSWWMLLMTAAYFHTWFEKLTGLLTAWLGIFVVFMLPRVIPAFRDLIGMPGV